MTNTPNYSPPYIAEGNCLYLIAEDKRGQTRKKLCNFAPYIVQQVTKNDGADSTTWVTVSGIHESGRTLPPTTVRGSELNATDWVIERWGAECIPFAGRGVKEHIRVAIQTTAESAEKITIYTITGWKQIDGQWHFLMPGSEDVTVELPGKLQGYHFERNYSYCDIATAGALLSQLAAPEEVTFTLLAEIFLSPLNHFLRMAGCEPKFILWLIGKTGSRKSTMAGLLLSFFGTFTATTLPLSFRDTANSINEQCYMVKDLPVVIDDFHPCGHQEQTKMTATAQNIARNYGDRAGKSRLTLDCDLRAARPPQGNAIVTAEFPPDIGESGTARCFTIELKRDDVDLQTLTSLQRLAADGTLNRCGFAYTEWLLECFLCDEETEKQFIKALRALFEKFRTEFNDGNKSSHGRVAENVAWLRMGFHFFLMFLEHHLSYSTAYVTETEEQFKEMLYRIACRQSDAIEQDKPTHLFLRKFFSLLESGQVYLKDLETRAPTDFQPGICVGYCDHARIYFFADQVHRLVRKLCDDQGEHFSISSKALLKALAEEGFIETYNGQNTKSMRLDGKSRRVVVMDKFKAQVTIDGACENLA